MLTRLGRLRARSGSKLPAASVRSRPWDVGLQRKIYLLKGVRSTVFEFLRIGCTKLSFLKKQSQKKVFTAFFCEFVRRSAKMKPGGIKSEKMSPEGTKREPKVSQREPKGSQREPKGSQKGAKGSPKGAKREPTGSQRRARALQK